MLKIFTIRTFVFAVLLILTGCGEEKSEHELRLIANKAMQNKSYNRAGKNYFKLWCNYPESNVDSLFNAAKAYAMAGKIKQVFELLADYSLLSEDKTDEIYYVKALAYYNHIKTPLKNTDKASKALKNLKQISYPLNKEQLKMLEYLENMIDYANLMHLRQLLTTNPPSVLYALMWCQKQIKNRPNSLYRAHFKQIEQDLINTLTISRAKIAI